MTNILRVRVIKCAIFALLIGNHTVDGFFPLTPRETTYTVNACNVASRVKSRCRVGSHELFGNCFAKAPRDKPQDLFCAVSYHMCENPQSNGFFCWKSVKAPEPEPEKEPEKEPDAERDPDAEEDEDGEKVPEAEVVPPPERQDFGLQFQVGQCVNMKCDTSIDTTCLNNELLGYPCEDGFCDGKNRCVKNCTEASRDGQACMVSSGSDRGSMSMFQGRCVQGNCIGGAVVYP